MSDDQMENTTDNHAGLAETHPETYVEGHADLAETHPETYVEGHADLAENRAESLAPGTNVLPGMEEFEPAPGPDRRQLRAALEAVLLVVDQPVTEEALAQALEQPAELTAELLAELAAEYTAQERGFDLRRAAGGWRLYTRAEFASYVEAFILEGQQARLSQAALETLAVVAYRQPVTRSRISAIRGVNCDGVIRTLLARGLVEEIGTEPETGAYLYRTTGMFLEKLGLDSLDELPPLAPFLPDDVDALDPDLARSGVQQLGSQLQSQQEQPQQEEEPQPESQPEEAQRPEPQQPQPHPGPELERDHATA